LGSVAASSAIAGIATKTTLACGTRRIGRSTASTASTAGTTN